MKTTNTPAADFVAGFEYVLRDWAAGITWEASVDLATTPVNKRSQAFCDGARAAADALARRAWITTVYRVGKAHGVTAEDAEKLVARAILA